MPARPNYLPNHRERTAFQLLCGHGEVPLKELHPTGLATVAKMLSKAWIERIRTGAYRITPAGEVALRAHLSANHKLMATKK